MSLIIPGIIEFLIGLVDVLVDTFRDERKLRAD